MRYTQGEVQKKKPDRMPHESTKSNFHDKTTYYVHKKKEKFDHDTQPGQEQPIQMFHIRLQRSSQMMLKLFPCWILASAFIIFFVG